MEESLRKLIGGLPNAAIVVDASGRVAEANEHAVRLFGWPHHELVGLMVEALVPVRYRDRHRDLRADYLENPEPRALGIGRELEALSRDGTEVPVEISLIPIEANGEALTLAIVLDLTERKRLEREREAHERRLIHQALHDPVTGLANRALLHQSLRESVHVHREDGASAALLLFDLHEFRQVNRLHGHRTGDALLQAAGKRLQEAIPGAVVARLDSDKFAVLTGPLLGEEVEAVRTAEGGRDALRELGVGEYHHRVKSSAGVALIAMSNGDSDSVLGFAEEAVREAKARGGDCTVLYDRSLADRLRAAQQLERELRTALDGDEIWVAYQPIVRLADRSIAGFEALARWHHRGGEIPPDEFIPIAERTRMINAIGAQVLEEAALRAASWQQQTGRSELGISVNAAAPQLESTDFPGEVSAILDRTGLAPSSLCLEVTETALLQDLKVCARRIGELKEMGVHVALDDFGTGYSSLSHWINLSFDALKLDRSFIARLTTDPRCIALVKALTVACPDLGTTEIAEGVETDEQAELLRSMGVELAQGYLFGRPMPATEAGALLNGGGSVETRPGIDWLQDTHRL